MSDIAIKIENLSKQYRLGVVGTGTLSHDLKRWWAVNILGKEDPYLKIGEENDRSTKSSSNYVWALKDINLEIKQGDVVGIIGKNGAGKSTLLKILSRVTKPSTGSISYKGRIASLLEVGTGFHPEMTGRENIYMNGAIMGMTKLEITHKLDEIIDFAGVERYINTPVKRYSSGMTVRLGFSIAAHLEPDILVVDEVLAVGDAEFQKKAIGKMQDVSRQGGRTVLFVSHNIPTIQALCSKSILLQHGRLTNFEDTSTVINEYLYEKLITSDIPLSERTDREGLQGIKMNKLEVFAPNGISTGNKITFSCQYTSFKGIPIKEFGLSIWTIDEIKIISISSLFTNTLNNIPQKGNVSCEIPILPLVSGKYIVNFFISSANGIEDYVTNILRFQVNDADYFDTGKTVNPLWGLIVVDHKWTIN